ncbi:MAG: hypothetical protein Q7J64_02820 [Elusimicrobiota bacterium]|nr:hypothetical protein [Elusimicrobiota bacterium]
MSLRIFHRFFLLLCLTLFAFLGYWASGGNATAMTTPWLQLGSVAGAAGVIGYFVWHVRAVRLPA